jgi:hypothetical protein
MNEGEITCHSQLLNAAEITQILISMRKNLDAHGILFSSA